MPELIKVGFSTKDPSLRADELNNTGVPHPFLVEYEVLVEEPYLVEQKTHQLLTDRHERKEWFRCDVETAITAIKMAAGNNVIFESERSNAAPQFQRTYQPSDFTCGYPMGMYTCWQKASKQSGNKYYCEEHYPLATSIRKP